MLIRTTLLAVVAGLIAPAQTTTGWKLVWSDEFNDAAGTAPDPAKWNYDLGNNNGWGNGEVEVYTNSLSNVFQDGKGHLVIRAIRDASGKYTSARLQTGRPGASTHTADLSWQYGRIEARIKLPLGKGVWPAFWMLGENIGSVGWPMCGEIDIMENFGTYHNNAVINNGTAHGPGYSGGNGIGKSYTLPFGEKVNDDYHAYAIEWSQDSIEWFVDGASYHKVTPASIPTGRQWVFNNPFFILLNLAIGGPSTFLGTPDANAPFPVQDMLVDYVRVYQSTAISAETPVITPGRVVNAASFLGTIAPGSLATVYGNNFAGGTDQGVTVTVDGVSAPLTYVSPTQINFQVPWETIPGLAVNVKVTRDGLDRNVEPVAIADATAPTMFLSEYVTGVAWVTGTGCESTECAVQPGVEYQMWGSGSGPSPASWELTIGGQTASVDYCGFAPGQIIDRLNFEYPPRVPAGSPWVDATLTINGVTGRFRVPAPAG